MPYLDIVQRLESSYSDSPPSSYTLDSLLDSSTFVSTCLVEGFFNPYTHDLILSFTSGSTYRYSDVPDSVWASLLSALSHGRFFVYNIRNNYVFSRML